MSSETIESSESVVMHHLPSCSCFQRAGLLWFPLDSRYRRYFSSQSVFIRFFVDHGQTWLRCDATTLQAPMPTKRAGFCAVCVDDAIFALGGFSDGEAHAAVRRGGEASFVLGARGSSQSVSRTLQLLKYISAFHASADHRSEACTVDAKSDTRFVVCQSPSSLEKC